MREFAAFTLTFANLQLVVFRVFSDKDVKPTNRIGHICVYVCASVMLKVSVHLKVAKMVYPISRPLASCMT